jgi:RNA polymerase sigma-70 factor (ECF subfamily)
MASQRSQEMTANTLLLTRAKSGDFNAFQEIVAQLQPRIYGLSFRLLQHAEDAEDVTQQTFMAIIEHVDQFREESSVATWALRIATNFALKVLRKRRGLKTISMLDGGEDDSYSNLPHPRYIAPWSKTPEEIVQAAELQVELERALQNLDEKYRIVFSLRDIEGLSVRQTADALELSESAVKVRLLRARLALREILTEKFGDSSRAIVPDHHHG